MVLRLSCIAQFTHADFSPLKVISDKIALLGIFGNDNPMRGSAIGDEDNRKVGIGSHSAGSHQFTGFYES
jgi:hypothetical protein